MTKKKIKETEDKVLEKLLGGEDALIQYHKLVEDLWEQAFKGKIDINTLRAKQEFEDKVLEAISNPTHDTTTEIKPDQFGDFSPIEIKSTVTEDGIQIDTKVIEEEDISKIYVWENPPLCDEEDPNSDKLKERACEEISKRFDKNVNKIFEDGKKRLEENRKLRVSGTEEKLKPTYEEFKADWERRKTETDELERNAAEEEEASSLDDWEQLDAWEKWEQEETVSDIAEAAFERIRNNEIKVVIEELKKGNLPNFEEAMSAAMEDKSERTKEENEKCLKKIEEELAEDFKKIKEERIHLEKQKEEIGRGARERLAEIKEFGIGLKAKAEEVKKEAMRLKMEARSQGIKDIDEMAIEKPEFPKFKDYWEASLKGSEEHTHMMKEGKRLTRLVYRDKVKLNADKMFRNIVAAISLHTLTFVFWVCTRFFELGQTGEVIIYLLMAAYTFFYVLVSVKAYESIKIQRKIEEVDRKYEGY
jgi:hypothetical protein